ncbi:MAG TPA: Fur family transcriptional regulator [Burkholderiaceae bacterium]|nr:Fur family transcriptional regulator [Burkholderiaceae bacterium]
MPAKLTLTPAQIKAQLKTAEQLCLRRNKRLTPMRRKVLQILLQHGRSLKAYELLEEVRKDHTNAAPPTVYRALDFLVDEGLIHRLDAVNAWTACLDADGEPHNVLIVCTECGVVAELSDPPLSHQLSHTAKQAGFIMANPETELRALCTPCHQQND